jgi:hypothetical protein
MRAVSGRTIRIPLFFVAVFFSRNRADHSFDEAANAGDRRRSPDLQ